MTDKFLLTLSVYVSSSSSWSAYSYLLSSVCLILPLHVNLYTFLFFFILLSVINLVFRYTLSVKTETYHILQGDCPLDNPRHIKLSTYFLHTNKSVHLYSLINEYLKNTRFSPSKIWEKCGKSLKRSFSKSHCILARFKRALMAGAQTDTVYSRKTGNPQ